MDQVSHMRFIQFFSKVISSVTSFPPCQPEPVNQTYRLSMAKGQPIVSNPLCYCTIQLLGGQTETRREDAGN